MKAEEMDTEDFLNEGDVYNAFSEHYTYIETLGKGAFGYVVKALYKPTGETFAVKVISKQNVGPKEFERLRQESEILKSLDHKNIVMFKHLIESGSRIFIAMELLEQGQLQTLIQERKKSGEGFTDLEASTIMKNILQAVDYVHDRGIVHRDIKPENILIGQKDDFNTIKLADFGLSAKYDYFSYKRLDKKCGTAAYMAPEVVLKKEYSKSVDIWSIGIIMYILCSGGHHPLLKSKKDKEEDEYKAKLTNPVWEFPPTFSLFRLARNLFLRFEKVDPLERYTAKEALLHPWITRLKGQKIPPTLVEFYQQIDMESRLKTAMLSVFFVTVSIEQEEQEEFIQYKRLLDKVSNKIQEWAEQKSIHKQGSFEEDEEFEIDSVASPNSFDVTTDETSTQMKPSSKRSNRGRSLIRLIKLDSPSKKLLDQVKPSQKGSSSFINTSSANNTSMLLNTTKDASRDNSRADKQPSFIIRTNKQGAVKSPVKPGMTGQNFMKRVSQDLSTDKNRTSEIMREKSQDVIDKKIDLSPNNQPKKEDIKPININSKSPDNKGTNRGSMLNSRRGTKLLERNIVSREVSRRPTIANNLNNPKLNTSMLPDKIGGGNLTESSQSILQAQDRSGSNDSPFFNKRRTANINVYEVKLEPSGNIVAEDKYFIKKNFLSKNTMGANNNMVPSPPTTHQPVRPPSTAKRDSITRKNFEKRGSCEKSPRGGNGKPIGFILADFTKVSPTKKESFQKDPTPQDKHDFFNDLLKKIVVNKTKEKPHLNKSSGDFDVFIKHYFKEDGPGAVSKHFNSNLSTNVVRVNKR